MGEGGSNHKVLSDHELFIRNTWLIRFCDGNPELACISRVKEQSYLCRSVKVLEFDVEYGQFVIGHDELAVAGWQKVGPPYVTEMGRIKFPVWEKARWLARRVMGGLVGWGSVDV